MSHPTYHFTFADAFTKLDWGVVSWRDRKRPPVEEIRVQAARNEVVGFQVHVSAEDEFVLVTDRANWLHPLGFVPRVRLEVTLAGLDLSSVEVLPVGWVEGDDRRLWMEYLDRAGTVEVPAGRPQAVFVRLRVPADLAPGEYVGKVQTFTQQGFEDEVPAWEGKITLFVSRVTLPPVHDYTFHMNLWQHLTSLSRFYRVPLWSEEHFAIIDRYYASLAQLGQKAVTLIVSEIPWSGQRCYRDRAYPSYLFEHSLVGVTRGSDGRLRLDYSALDRALALAAKHGIDREIDLYGLINIWVDEAYGFGKVAPDAPDAIRLRCYDEATGTFVYLRKETELIEYVRALHDHLEEVGVMERVRVSADEPHDLEAFNRSLAWLQSAGKKFRYGAAINHFEFLENAPTGLIDFVPVLPLACRDPELTARLVDNLREKGGRMLWYICCWPPIPNTFVHSPLVESRLLGWVNHALGLDGFLRWAFCLWPANPWERVSWRAPEWFAGDMYVVLPGKDGAPVETLRYEGLRAAVQDYELLKMVERSLPAEKARAVIEQARGCLIKVESLSAFAEVDKHRAEELYSLDPEDYHRAKGMLIEALEKG